jgi:hypothetical protein
MPRISAPAGLPDLLNRQLSLASRSQLLHLGMKDNSMQYRLRVGGPWQAVLPGVYLTTSGVPSIQQKEMAALLYAGPDSVITGPVALIHHCIRSDGDTSIINVLVPTERQRLSTGFVKLHRTARMPPRTCAAGPVRLALAPRAVADTARLLTDFRDVRAVIAESVQLGRCSLRDLAEELSGSPITPIPRGLGSHQAPPRSDGRSRDHRAAFFPARTPPRARHGDEADPRCPGQGPRSSLPPHPYHPCPVDSTVPKPALPQTAKRCPGCPDRKLIRPAFPTKTISIQWLGQHTERGRYRATTSEFAAECGGVQAKGLLGGVSNSVYQDGAGVLCFTG